MQQHLIMTINQLQDEIIEEFEGMDEWLDRYAYIIDLGNALHTDETLRVPDNKIEGCQSDVWIDAALDTDGNIVYRADSNSSIVKGIAALLVRVLSGHKPADVTGAHLYFIDRIGLSSHLSPTRSNGLLAMRKRMHAYALALQATAG